jgi:hypothetical protein
VWLAAEAPRRGAEHALSLQWLKAYVMSVRTKDDALEAIDAMAKFEPPPPDLIRTSEQDEALGTMYLTAGRAAEALPYLRRAARSCGAFDSPIERTRASLHLGHALEETGNAASACAAYGEIASRWSSMGSVSARDAEELRRALHCP